jgi:hypothetical protein
MYYKVVHGTMYAMMQSVPNVGLYQEIKELHYCLSNCIYVH